MRKSAGAILLLFFLTGCVSLIDAITTGMAIDHGVKRSIMPLMFDLYEQKMERGPAPLPPVTPPAWVDQG